MAVADSNKPLLVAEGDTRTLDTCATVLGWGTPGGPVDGGGGRWAPLKVRQGQERCSEALFQLSLSAAGKRAMRAHDGCMRVLRHHARAADDVEVGGRCRGALAAMEERHGARTGAAVAAAAKGAGHLMISYQWDVQLAVLRIAASMRTRGFRVWVDTEMMSGSTLDAMAAAVEDAHCVLICITELYKKSANCRLEGTCESWARGPAVRRARVCLGAVAEGLVLMLGSLSGARALFVVRAADVHEQRKPWVPLILEASYRPKGWLGIMLGSRLYYEFTEAALSNGEDWERVADGVAQEVRRHGAPAPISGPMAQAVAEGARPQDAVDVVAAAAPAVPKGVVTVGPAPTREAAGGVNVHASSVAHRSNITISSSNTNNSTNANSIGNIAIGNTSIVLL